MSVFRVNKNNNYTTMSNYHLKDKRISLKAKGLLSEMLSLPDDWNYTIEGLASINKESAKQIKLVLDELKQYQYLYINKLMPNETKTGRIEYIYDIYEIPKTRVPKQEGCKQEVENKRVVLGDNKILKQNTDIQNTNKEIDNNNTIYDFLQQNGFVLTSIHYDIIKTWEDNELTRYAIKKAVLNNKYNIKYIDSILYSYKTNNIKTVEQAIAQDEEFKKRTNEYYKNKFQTKKQTKEDIIPDWFNKDYSNQKLMTDKDYKEEMDKILEEIGE